MADGSRKQISDVEIGDKVLATDPETGETVAREVTAVFAHEDTVIDLAVEDGGTVTTTSDHPFWNETDEEWQQADDLDEGDKLRTAEGDTITVEGLDEDSERTATAYNLTVDQTHTFYVTVGHDEALVHNTCPLADGWRGTNMTPDESFDYHYSRHGSGVSREQYATDARNWASGADTTRGTRVTLADGTTGYRIRTPGGGPGGIIDAHGNVITFWYR
jgi:hypothetical protein